MKSAAGAVISSTSERDIYELIANYGQRRKRAVLLAVIPGDITEAALEQCERTMEAEADISDEGLKKLVEAFAALNVTQAQIETRIQRRLDAIRPAQVVALRKVYNSLRDGMSEVGDWFDAVEQTEPVKEAAASPPAPAERQSRRRATAAAEAPAQQRAPAAPAAAASNETAKSDAAAAPPKRRVNFEV